MAFGPETYRAAALEHIKLAQDLHAEHRYAMAHYVSGLAVECVLRAYHFRRTREFDSRHVIESIYFDSGYDRIVPKARRQDIRDALSVVSSRWRNSHRFRSTADLERFLLEQKLQRGLTGDLLEASSTVLLNAALQIVELGEIKWQA